MDLHRIALGTHALLAVWLLVNGVAHQLGLLLGAWRGTLRHPEDLGPMLAVGAGLLVAGSLASWSLADLARGATTFALGSLVALAIVVVMIAARYGWTFLGGTVALGLVDLLALAALARPQSG